MLGLFAVVRARQHACARHTYRGVVRRMSTPNIPRPPDLKSLTTPEDNARARSWVEDFKARRIPRELVELSFARSSGPGGQNVNKVNTKATVRCPVNSKWIPAWSREGLERSPSYVSSSETLLVTSTVHRSQAQNVEDCLAKLHALVLSASAGALIAETSETQKARVRRFEAAERAQRKQFKDKRSAIKRSRSNRGADWD